MKFKSLIMAMVISFFFTTTEAADKNLSWDVKTLRSQSITQRIKAAKLKKYMNIKYIRTKNKAVKEDQSISTRMLLLLIH